MVGGRAREARSWLEGRRAQRNPKSVEAALLAASLAWERATARRRGGSRTPRRPPARAEAPVRGVLSEGDRRPAPAQARGAAPPLENPMGRMLSAGPGGGARPDLRRRRLAPRPRRPVARDRTSAGRARPPRRAPSVARGTEVNLYTNHSGSFRSLFPVAATPRWPPPG